MENENSEKYNFGENLAHCLVNMWLSIEKEDSVYVLNKKQNTFDIYWVISKFMEHFAVILSTHSVI